jgi:hypothetical protein
MRVDALGEVLPRLFLIVLGVLALVVLLVGLT